VLLATDYTSRIPAVVRRGRWWGIARGNLTSVVVEYIAQDAPLRVGDVVVTGEGRSFHSGVPIGTVTAVERGSATLYQTAVLKTAADLNALDRVVVVPQ
jgi:cell shape-determining protein MreC